MVRILLLLLVLAGCDTREFAGPGEGPDDGGTRDAELASVTYLVQYELQATYVACDLRYRDAGGVVRTEREVPPPWSARFQVTVEPSGRPFEAFLEATCHDLSKNGKSYVLLLLDGALQAQDSKTGFGARAEVRSFLWVE